MSKFTVAGVSTGRDGITKVRFANDIVSRTKILAKGDCFVELIELPKPMTKSEACQHLLDTEGAFTQWAGLIIETMAKKEGTPIAAKVVPVKAKAPATKQAKISKPKVEEDLEVTEIKELADAPF